MFQVWGAECATPIQGPISAVSFSNFTCHKPTLVSSSNSSVVMETNVTIHCSYHGDPAPAVTLRAHWSQLPLATSQPSVNKSVAITTVSYTITNIQCAHMGKKLKIYCWPELALGQPTLPFLFLNFYIINLSSNYSLARDHISIFSYLHCIRHYM